jgi:signal transduction histidine kinase/tetratricopeptide (TPR) repeat protein
MRDSVWQRLLLQPGHRLLAIFVTCILLPGVVLAVLGLRALGQDRQLADQQIRESLEAAAARTGADVERGFRGWQDAVQAIADQQSAGDLNTWPQSIQHVVAKPGGAVLVTLSGEHLQAYPAEQLLYRPGLEEERREDSGPSSPALARAGILELRQGDYPGAIRIYKELLDSATPELRPFYLHRLARSYRRAGRTDAALQAYRELAQLEAVRAGTLPLDLIARFEICALLSDSGESTALSKSALDLYQDLANGRWRIGKSSFYYYSGRVLEWLRDGALPGEDIQRLQTQLETKLALTEAVDALLTEPRRVIVAAGKAHLAFWRSDPFIALVLSTTSLESDFWPPIFSPEIEKGFTFTLSSPEGHLIYGTPASGRAAAVVRTLSIDNRAWQLQVLPQDPEAFYAGLRRKQGLYMSMLVVMVALLGFGGYLVTRTVKRELEIARMRADFVSTVSHEFRSPLTGIRQLGEMLLDGRVRSEEKQRGYYRLIVQESRRLGRLVENILDFSRMEEGRKTYRLAPFDSSAWLRRLVDDFRTESAQSGTSIVSHIPDTLPPLCGDAEALACAVHNLLDNAVKYSPGSKTVWLDVTSEDGRIAISVRDEGAGISEQDQRHIFEKFYRADGEISRKVKGAGLGLSLVRHIVTAHGGDVECASRPRQGSTFTIRLPVVPPTSGG